MPWVISFITSWVLFFLLTDNKQLKKYILGGVLAVLLGTIVDFGGQRLELYRFNDIIISWAGCSAFYKFGPVFTMGVLFCQYVPRSKWLQTAHILMCSVFYALLELAIICTGAAEYIHWNILASFVVDIAAFCTFTWLTLAFMREK